MTKLLLFLLLSLAQTSLASIGPQAIISHKASSSPICGTYSHYRIVTIPAQSSLTGNISNYPVEVSGTYSYLAGVSSGGLSQNANGYDIGFFTDNTCTTKLPWETELYTSTTGAVTYWVQLPTISKTVSNTFVLAYDSLTITTDQSNATGVWDSNFKGVWHLPNGTTLTTLDSTSNAANGTNHSVTAGTGQIDGAGVFSGTESPFGCTLGGSSYIQTSSPATTATTSVTLSGWANTTSNILDGQTVLYNGSDASSNGYGMFVNKESVTSGDIYILYGAIAWWDTGTVVSSSTWHSIALTLDAGGTGATVYLDGTSIGTHTFGSAPNTPNTHSIIGCSDFSAHRAFAGNLDELRISNSIRSADWIVTDYNNQSSPSTFYSIGSQF